MALHYILVVLVILTIIGIQAYIYRNTRKKIYIYKSIFPESTTSYSIRNMDLEVNEEEHANEETKKTITVSQILIHTQNSTLKEIRNALNMYLQKNRGAASDFHLMKDVVERYCDADEEEITIQQPIPLYLGLMGTMIGIIVGIGFIAFSRGLSNEALLENITSLMICVAIAMIASLVGIICTTLISWESKSATTKVEANKNKFNSWLQTELLPVLSGTAVNALYLLQQNLMTFNHTFQTNIEGLDGALAKVTDSSQKQIELISLIKNIDIKRVAQANITVLKELKDCTSEISLFNKYLHNVSGYLEAVNNLNSNINEHLTRTAAIEKMGAFFEREINQVTEREKYINEVVSKIDDTLRKTFEQLQESTKEGVTQLRDRSITEFDTLIKQYKEQKEEFAKILQEQREKIVSHSAETTEIIQEIHNLVDIKDLMGQLLESTKSQTEALNKLAISVKNINMVSAATNQETAASSSPIQLPKSIVYMAVVTTIIIIITFSLYIYNSFFATSNNESFSSYITRPNALQSSVLENRTPRLSMIENIVEGPLSSGVNNSF